MLSSATTTGIQLPRRRAARAWQHCEIVRVASPAFLVDARRRACRYVAGEGRLLDPGYYLVLWPARASTTDFGAEVLYLGPFPTENAAGLLRTSAFDLGVVTPEPEKAPSFGVSSPQPPCVPETGPQLALEFA